MRQRRSAEPHRRCGESLRPSDVLVSFVSIRRQQKRGYVPTVGCLRKRRVPDDGVMFNTRKFMSRISSDTGPAGIHVSQMKFGAIINASSGGCDSESETEMLDILKSAGVTNCKTWCGESDQIERAFAEAATHKPKMLVVLGGDGTIRTAAEACTGTDTYLLPLPGTIRRFILARSA